MFPPKPIPPASQENARDIADAIDDLIRIRISAALRVHDKAYDQRSLMQADADSEIIKRRITDYLLATDPRSGVYKSPHYQPPTWEAPK
jgi:hypothetical protein